MDSDQCMRVCVCVSTCLHRMCRRGAYPSASRAASSSGGRHHNKMIFILITRRQDGTRYSRFHPSNFLSHRTARILTAAVYADREHVDDGIIGSLKQRAHAGASAARARPRRRAPANKTSDFYQFQQAHQAH